MNDTMLKISHVSKQYKLGQIGGTTLREEIQRWNAKRRHQEDPTRKIGAREYKSGETFMALDDVSFEVKKGERVGIIGHNGAGKSTLLKLVSRVTAPTSGWIGLNGRVASMLEVGTGFHGELTGRENIYMNGAILGMKKKEIDAKIEDIIEFSECRQFIDTPVKRYSSGMYVKLAFAVAAHLDAEIMIMDEVLAVGDMKFQEKCLGKMDDVSQSEGRTILYVSHNMNTIRQLCNRCIVLDHGKLLFDGNVQEAVSFYAQSAQVSDTDVDLNKMARSEKFSHVSVWMERLRVFSEYSVFSFGSKMRACIYVRSCDTINNVRLEIRIKNSMGMSVTRFYSPPSMVLRDKTAQRLDFEIDISRLAPGKYSMSPILREVNAINGIKSLDGLEDAYYFEIISDSLPDTFADWDTYYSGFYIPPLIELLNC